MKKGLWLVVPLALVMVVGSLVGCASSVVPAAGSGAESLNLGSLSLQNSGIWVNGTGSVTVVPDLATLSLGVEARSSHSGGGSGPGGVRLWMPLCAPLRSRVLPGKTFRHNFILSSQCRNGIKMPKNW